MTLHFQAWPKTPRLFKEAVYTEKIDGTNGAIDIERITDDQEWENPGPVLGKVEFNNDRYVIGAQSRNRLITLEQDNAGFARYVADNAAGLVQTLGEGRHFGEWWGSGIQRGYGLPKGEKRFSLFNTRRWEDHQEELDKVPGLGMVPLLHKGIFSTVVTNAIIAALQAHGSAAVPGYMNPEGVCVFHVASQQVYKAFLLNDGKA